MIGEIRNEKIRCRGIGHKLRAGRRFTQSRVKGSGASKPGWGRTDPPQIFGKGAMDEVLRGMERTTKHKWATLNNANFIQG